MRDLGLITAVCPAALRLAFYQAANAARRVGPRLAGFYRTLMIKRGHCHTQATIAGGLQADRANLADDHPPRAV